MEKGFITSPFYPRNYPPGRECIYKISSPSGTLIAIEIISMEVDCSGADTIELRDGISSESPIIGVFCGTNNDMPSSIHTTQSSLWLKFSSSYKGIGKGFNISYQFINETNWSFNSGSCGGVLNSQNGIITSPSFPSNYPPAKDCVYDVSVASGQYVYLTFTIMDVHCTDSGIYDASPGYDYLEFRDGELANSPLIGKFCGNVSSVPKYIQTTQNHLRIRLDADKLNLKLFENSPLLQVHNQV